MSSIIEFDIKKVMELAVRSNVGRGYIPELVVAYNKNCFAPVQYGEAVLDSTSLLDMYHEGASLYQTKTAETRTEAVAIKRGPQTTLNDLMRVPLISTTTLKYDL